MHKSFKIKSKGDVTFLAKMNPALTMVFGEKIQSHLEEKKAGASGAWMRKNKKLQNFQAVLTDSVVGSSYYAINILITIMLTKTFKKIEIGSSSIFKIFLIVKIKKSLN